MRVCGVVPGPQNFPPMYRGGEKDRMPVPGPLDPITGHGLRAGKFGHPDKPEREREFILTSFIF